MGEKHLKQEGKRREDDEKKERMKRILIETEIQRICETSEELKELERNLKMAYVSKGRATQYEEKFFLKKIEDERERVIDEVMEIDRQNRIQQENMKEVNRREKLLAQKMVLQEQMHENEMQIEQARKEAIKDKEMIDKILGDINEENRLEVIERNKKREETKCHIAQYEAERKNIEKERIERELEHERKITEYSQMLMKRQDDKDRQKKEVEEQKKRLWNQVATQTENLNQARDEYNEMRNILWEEELEEKTRQKEENDKLQKLKVKKEMMKQNKEQIQARRALVQEMDKAERVMVNKMLEKFANDEKDELMKQKLCDEAKTRFMNEVQRQREERAQMYKTEKQMENQQLNAGAQQEEYRQRVIAEAKKKILQQHETHLKGFLPKGIVITK